MAFSCGDRLHRQAFFLSLSGNMLLDLPVRPTGFFLSFLSVRLSYPIALCGFSPACFGASATTFSMVYFNDFFSGGFCRLGVE
jgi:hypothetical protein